MMMLDTKSSEQEKLIEFSAPKGWCLKMVCKHYLLPCLMTSISSTKCRLAKRSQCTAASSIRVSV